MFAILASACKKVARDFDPSSLTASEALRAVEDLATMQHAIDAIRGTLAKYVDDTEAYQLKGARSAAAYVAGVFGTTTAEVNAAIKTATQLEELPATAAAVRNGELSARAAQLIAETATVNPAAETELLETAKQGLQPLRDACVKAQAAVEEPQERSARQHTERQFKSWVKRNGMIAGYFEMEPEVGGPVVKKVQTGVEKIFREHKNGTHEAHEAYAADALAQLVLAESAGSKQSRSKCRVHVLIDHDALVRGNALPGETCEIPGVGPVNAQWVRAQLGDAFATAIIKKGKDIRTVADVGRYRPAELDTALAVNGLECGIVGCYCRGYLEIDHHHDFAKGGPTTFENLGPKCSRHHDLKSRGWIEGPADPKTGKHELRPPPGWKE